MNNQERDVIAGIFQRLEQAAGQPRDADADRFIADKIRSQPYAPYAMVQLVYVQEEAVKSLNQQLEQLRAENEELRSRAQSAAGGGFLSSIFGGGPRQEPQPPRQGSAWGAPQATPPGYGQPAPGPGYGPPGGYPPGPQGGPWAGGAQQQPPARSGFLGSALTTAAGVAGGLVVGNALMNAFSGGHPSLGSSSALGNLGGGAQSAGNSDFGAPLHSGNQDAAYQDANYDDAGAFDNDDGMDDTGGSNDDWV